MSAISRKRSDETFMQYMIKSQEKSLVTIENGFKRIKKSLRISNK